MDQGGTGDRGDDDNERPSEAAGLNGQEPGTGREGPGGPTGEEQAPPGALPRPSDAQPDAHPHPADSQAAQPASQGHEGRDGVQSGSPAGGGLPDDDRPTGAQAEPPPLAEADEANLEYARKATDLVLERLKDQQNEADPELLKSLDWTQDELQQFLARWEALKRAAREEGPAAQAELNDALRSLGLRATATVRRGVHAVNDQPGGLRDLGRSSSPPAEFLEQFNAYRKGRSRGASEGGARQP